MLYLNSVENVAASKTAKKYVTCYDTLPTMQIFQNWHRQRSCSHSGNLKKLVGSVSQTVHG